MKSVDFSRFFNPLYVLLAGLLGGIIIFLLFSPFFPLSCGKNQLSFFCAPGFFVMFFFMSILWGMIAILFIPGCKMFLWLFQKNVAEKGKRYSSRLIVELVSLAVISGASSIIVTGGLNLFYPDAQREWYLNVPAGVQRIIDINSVSLFLTFLPYILGVFLVYSLVQEIVYRLQENEPFKAEQPFDLIHDLLNYRKILQFFLNVSAALLSLVPLIMVAIRSVVISVNPQFGKVFPVTYVIFGGITYTLLLLFIYFPAYLELSIAGQKLRDALCPLASMDNLKDTIEKRKALDGLLQTEMNFTSNLKSGILTLGPLISSLLVFLGIKL